MKTRVNPSKSHQSILVTFHEGFSTYTITVPMPYAIQFFVEGIVSSLEALKQNDNVQKKLDELDGQKAQIQEYLRKAVLLYDEFLSKSSR
jgi:hypothetical protein